jgi:mRNA interferase MazF
MVTAVSRYDVVLVRLDPTQGSEIRKTRPCLIVSPDEMNRNISTVIVAPMTSKPRGYPTRADLRFQDVAGQVALDQIRTVDKRRLTRRLGRLAESEARAVADVLQQMFAYDGPDLPAAGMP